jgi:hypothetical protein
MRSAPNSQAETVVFARIEAYQLGTIGDITMTGSDINTMALRMSQRVAASSGNGSCPPR